jgi:uncharacterized lipoprotein YmbA
MHRWLALSLALVLLAGCAAHRPTHQKPRGDLAAFVDAQAIVELADAVQEARIPQKLKDQVLVPLKGDRLPLDGTWTRLDPDLVRNVRRDLTDAVRRTLPSPFGCQSACLGEYEHALPHCTGEEEICWVEISYRLCLLRCRLNS